MIKIGITGGIGSGKSTVCKIFEVLGIPVYYADFEAKKLIVENLEVKQALIKLLGKEAYIDNVYNIPYVKKRVLNDADLLKKLNQIVHPAVALHYIEWLKKHNDSSYIIKEAAIMNKGAGQDKIVYMSTSLATRLQRTLDRDLERNRTEVELIMATQKTEMEFLEIADFVIHNNEELLIPQVLKIHQEILEDAIS
jgi:dephospho-CoA kinase